MLSDSQIDELWRRLDEMGQDLVSRRLAQGVFGTSKRPLVEEWLRRQGQSPAEAIQTTTGRIDLFLSHADADRAIALRLKGWLEDLFPDLHVFVSSHRADIPLGINWMNAIRKNLESAVAYLVLVSQRSDSRNWVWLETGVAWSSGRDIIPMCLQPHHKATIPRPWSDFQGINLYEQEDVKDLVTRVAVYMKVATPAEPKVGELVEDCSRRNEEVSQRHQEASHPLPATPRLRLTSHLGTIGTGIVVHALVLSNAEAETIEITIQSFELRESDVSLPGSPEVLVENLNARWGGRRVPMAPSDELTIDDDVHPKTVACLVMHFSFSDPLGNAHDDAVQGV